MWAQNNVWAHVGIFVSGLMKLRPENLYLNNRLLVAKDLKLSMAFDLGESILLPAFVFHRM